MSQDPTSDETQQQQQHSQTAVQSSPQMQEPQQQRSESDVDKVVAPNAVGEMNQQQDHAVEKDAPTAASKTPTKDDAATTEMEQDAPAAVGDTTTEMEQDAPTSVGGTTINITDNPSSPSPSPALVETRREVTATEVGEDLLRPPNPKPMNSAAAKIKNIASQIVEMLEEDAEAVAQLLQEDEAEQDGGDSGVEDTADTVPNLAATSGGGLQPLLEEEQVEKEMREEKKAKVSEDEIDGKEVQQRPPVKPERLQHRGTVQSDCRLCAKGLDPAAATTTATNGGVPKKPTAQTAVAASD